MPHVPAHDLSVVGWIAFTTIWLGTVALVCVVALAITRLVIRHLEWTPYSADRAAADARARQAARVVRDVRRQHTEHDNGVGRIPQRVVAGAAGCAGTDPTRGVGMSGAGSAVSV